MGSSHHAGISSLMARVLNEKPSALPSAAEYTSARTARRKAAMTPNRAQAAGPKGVGITRNKKVKIQRTAADTAMLCTEAPQPPQAGLLARLGCRVYVSTGIPTSSLG